jgi:nucleoside 2-deoxyribosyltransferase
MPQGITKNAVVLAICVGCLSLLDARQLLPAQTAAKAQIYVAGPLGFSEAGRLFYYESFLKEIARFGVVLDPWSLTDKTRIDAVKALQDFDQRVAAWKRLNAQIGETNRGAIDRSDMVIAILDGPDVDSGTAAEIGYAFAKNKLIVGYRNDFRQAGDNEGAIVNLQVEYFIRRSGGTGDLAALDTLLEQLETAKTPK